MNHMSQQTKKRLSEYDCVLKTIACDCILQEAESKASHQASGCSFALLHAAAVVQSYAAIVQYWFERFQNINKGIKNWMIRPRLASHLISRRTISTGRSIRSRGALSDNGTKSNVNSFHQTRCRLNWIQISCIINLLQWGAILMWCKHNANVNMTHRRCIVTDFTCRRKTAESPNVADMNLIHTCCMLAIPWPLCQALQQVPSVQVVQQVQGVHGLQDHQKLLAFQAHPEEKWEDF